MQVLRNPARQDQAARATRPAHQQIYEALRAAILFGDLVPGQAVTLQGLTESLQAGMTPVREAVRRLTSDGALLMQGNRRVCVPELTIECIDQLEFMRLSLETELVLRAARQISVAQVDALEAVDIGLNDAISKGDIKQYLVHNFRFHRTLYAAADAPVIAATVERLWLRFGPSLRVVCGRFGTLNLPDRHAELLAALRKDDATGAMGALIEDIRQGMDQMRHGIGGTSLQC